MSSLHTKDIKKNLQKKGFIVDNQRDHIWFNYITTDGKKTPIRTKISHGKSDIGDDLISKMARQTRISKKQFVELVECSLSKDEYFELVKDII